MDQQTYLDSALFDKSNPAQQDMAMSDSFKDATFMVGAGFDDNGNIADVKTNIGASSLRLDESTNIDHSSKEDYTKKYEAGDRFEDKDVVDTKDINLSGITTDRAINTTTGAFINHGVGGNLNSILKGMQTPNASPGFTQSPHREALHNTFNSAYANQTGDEANYLASTLSSDLDHVVSGSKNNSDMMSVASSESVKAGWDASEFLGGIVSFTTGVTGSVGVEASATQKQDWTNDTHSQVNNAMVRGMLENSNGDLDKFNQDYMSYKNALLDMGQEAKKQSDLDGKKI